MADRKEGRLASSEAGMAQSSVVFSRCFYCSSAGFYNWLDLDITDQDKVTFLKIMGLCVCVPQIVCFPYIAQTSSNREA